MILAGLQFYSKGLKLTHCMMNTRYDYYHHNLALLKPILITYMVGFKWQIVNGHLRPADDHVYPDHRCEYGTVRCPIYLCL